MVGHVDTQPGSRAPDRRAPAGYPDLGVLLALGLGGGVALGAAFGAIGLGLVVGLEVATIVNAALEWRRGAPGARTAMAISVAGAVVVSAIVLWP